MPYLTIDQIIELMNNQNNIRNISIISNINHGKSTLIKYLSSVSSINIPEKSNGTRICYSIEEIYTFKSPNIPLYYKYDINETGKKEEFLINLINSLKYKNFFTETINDLRISDGAIILVDYVEGVCVQTTTFLKQCLKELTKPVLMINKFDKAFLELEHDTETIYQNLLNIIQNINDIISVYQEQDLVGDLKLCPDLGNVIFGSAFYGWGFTLNTFAKMYSEKFKINKNKLIEKLWGNNYYDSKNKKWINENKKENEKLKNGFTEFILEPLIKLTNVILSDEKEVYELLFHKLNIELKDYELKEQGKSLLTTILQKWIKLSNNLLEMIIIHIPSPKISQKYKTLYLYEGQMDDECATAMISCDPEGPLMMFISNMIYDNDNNKIYAFGRIFSGKINFEEKVKILGPNYIQGKKNDYYEKTIRQIIFTTNKNTEILDNIPCGNICCLGGVEKRIFKQATITNSLNACTIKSMKYSKSPFVKIAVNASNPSDLPKLIEGLYKLAKTDPLINIDDSETEYVICGYGELHIENSIKNLIENFADIEITKSKPYVTYYETITEVSDICMSKSDNKYNELYVNSEPLKKDLIESIENNKNDVLNLRIDTNEIPKLLINKYELENEIKNLWVFGPDYVGSNILVNETNNIKNINEIKEAMEISFEFCTKAGVLAEETLKGVRFNIKDLKLHSDAIHRRMCQILPAAKRVYIACEIKSKPKFQEPIYLCNINFHQNFINDVYHCLSQRKFVILNEESIQGTELFNINGYLAVSQSFGFYEELKNLTNNQFFLGCTFSHWEIIDEDPFDVNSEAYKIAMDIRKRKGIELKLPVLEDYNDKI